MEVHVVIFEHRHGCDISAYANSELAVAEGARIARTWWPEARRLDSSLPEEPPAADAEAMELYFRAQEGYEAFEIARCTLHDTEQRVPVRTLSPPIDQESNQIVVLDDGETFSGADGARIYEVPEGWGTEEIERALAIGALKPVADVQPPAPGSAGDQGRENGHG